MSGLDAGFDGGASGGRGGTGYYIDASDGTLLLECSERVTGPGRKPGEATCNEGEWMGMFRILAHVSACIEALKAAGFTHIRIQGDSKLVIQQLAGIFQVRAPNLQKVAAFCKKMVADLNDKHGFVVDLRHVPRAQNKRADALATRGKALSIEAPIETKVRHALFVIPAAPTAGGGGAAAASS